MAGEAPSSPLDALGSKLMWRPQNLIGYRIGPALAKVDTVVAFGDLWEVLVVAVQGFDRKDYLWSPLLLALLRFPLMSMLVEQSLGASVAGWDDRRYW